MLDGRTIIGERLGDGPWTAAMPKRLRGVGRRFAGFRKRETRRRLIRALDRLYPRIKALEALTMPEGSWLLQGLSFDEALEVPDCVDRAWQVFQAAWKAGFILILDDEGETIRFADSTAIILACGLELKEVEAYVVALAAHKMFKENPLALEKLEDCIEGMEDLPKLHILVTFDALKLEDLRQAFGERLESDVVGLPVDQLRALGALETYAIHALRQSMGREFTDIIDWDYERLLALAKYFTCVEQYRDLGPYLTTVEDPEAIKVLGEWPIRDVTEQVNSQRKKDGRGRLKGRRFETDIAIVRAVLEAAFEDLLVMTPPVIDAVGRAISQIRHLDKAGQLERMKLFRSFSARYLEYLNHLNVRALRLGEEDVTASEEDAANTASLAEIQGVLNGLWEKKGYGRPFFEGPFQTEEGSEAIKGLIAAMLEMKKRGTAVGEEMSKIVSKTDLLDDPIKKFEIQGGD
ncbi:MAG: hypothetical protein ACPGOY_15665 [Rhodospirillaceae bacterium]